MGIGPRMRALILLGFRRPMIAGLVLGFALLLITQASPAQQTNPVPQPNAIADDGADKASKATKSLEEILAKNVRDALKEKCRTPTVESALTHLYIELPDLKWGLAAWEELEHEEQRNLALDRQQGVSSELMSITKEGIQRTSGYIRDIKSKIAQDESDLKKLEAKPACAGTSAATQPPPPGESGAVLPCGDVSAEIKRLTEEATRLSKEETNLKATLAKHTSEYTASARDYGSADPRAQSAAAAMTNDQKQLIATQASIQADKKRIVALYGVPPCTETPQAAAPLPPAPSPGPPQEGGQNLPCRTKDDDSEYVRLDAELERLSQEHEKLFPAATNPAGKAALNENNKKIEDVMRKKDAIRAREPCPPQPAAGQVPPENEHGMAPTQPSGPGFPFGFGGGSFGFGFGGGSDEGQSDRGIGKNQNRKP